MLSGSSGGDSFDRDAAMFCGLELEEPSFEVDEAILTSARAPRSRIVAPPSPSLLVGLVATAAILAVGVTTFSGWFENAPLRSSTQAGRSERSPVGSATPTTGVGVAAEALALQTDILRAELAEIRRRAPDIPESRRNLRIEIEQRLEVCLADLGNVERRLAALRQ